MALVHITGAATGVSGGTIGTWCIRCIQMKESHVSKFETIEEDGLTASAPRFHTVAEVARMLRVSRITVYRAIHDGELPAVAVRGRWAVPARVISEMEATALAALVAPDRNEEWRRPEASARAQTHMPWSVSAQTVQRGGSVS